MIIIAAIDIPCPVCKAAAGECCTYLYHAGGGKKRRAMRYTYHGPRGWDALAAQKAARALLE